MACTLAAVAMGMLLFVLTISMDLEVFEAFVEWLEKHEDYELDEWVIPIFLLSLGVMLDGIFANAERQKSHTRLSVYNHMNKELLEEIAAHLERLIEFRTGLRESHPDEAGIHSVVNTMIIDSYRHFQRAQMRADVDGSVLPLVLPADLESRPQGLVPQPKIA